MPLAPPGVYTARKHHVPVTLAVIAAEVPSDAGGLELATAVAVTGLPTWVPPIWQAPPITSFGLQTKNVMVPVGVPSAVEAAVRLSPDVVIMDIRMRSMDGLEVTRTIMARMPRPPKVVVLTTFDYDEYVYEALKAGASAFLLKDSPQEQLIAAVHVVTAGDALLHPSIHEATHRGLRRPPDPADRTAS